MYICPLCGTKDSKYFGINKGNLVFSVLVVNTKDK